MQGGEQKLHLETDSSRVNFTIYYAYHDNERAYLIPSTEVGSDKMVAMAGAHRYSLLFLRVKLFSLTFHNGQTDGWTTKILMILMIL